MSDNLILTPDFSDDLLIDMTKVSAAETPDTAQLMQSQAATAATAPTDLLTMGAHSSSIIKVIGVGGGGNNAVANMYRENIEGVRFMVCNTDQKALMDSPVPDQLQLGPGLGAGGNPEIGRELAEESLNNICEALDDGTKMVFITAGMGGGTGTGAAPVIAREAKAKGILTIGIVTIPFLFEMKPRIDKALDGVDEISKYVDALLVVNNERLRHIYADCTMTKAFRNADDTLTRAVRCIVEIINMRGKMHLDFRDVDTTLRDGQVAIMSYGVASGENRVSKAIETALNSPLLNDNDVFKSRKLLFCIHTAPDEKGYPLMVEEMNEIDKFMTYFNDQVETKYGIGYDDSLTDEVRVTILASGFRLTPDEDISFSVNGEDTPESKDLANKRRAKEVRRQHYYSPTSGNNPAGTPSSRSYSDAVSRQRLVQSSKIYTFGMDDLDNIEVVSMVQELPTATRSLRKLEQIERLATEKK